MKNSKREDLLASLERAQDEHGYLTREHLVEISRTLDIPLSDVFGVASFYSFLSTKPRGRNIIRICKSVPCHLKNAQTVIESVAAELGIGPDEITEDARFSLEQVGCIGACDMAPAMLINNDFYANLTPSKIARILGSYE